MLFQCIAISLNKTNKRRVLESSITSLLFVLAERASRVSITGNSCRVKESEEGEGGSWVNYALYL